MSAPRIVLTGQGHWSRILAKGLARHAGLAVQVAALDRPRDVGRLAAWRALLFADVIVRVGFRPGAATWRGQALDAAFAFVDMLGKKHQTIYYWIGSDVQRTVEEIQSGCDTRRFRRMAARGRHMAGSRPLQRDLATIGVDATLVDFAWAPVAAPSVLPPLPEGFTVLTYVPDARSDFYGGVQILRTARTVPGARFVVMGGSGCWAVDIPENVTFTGWVDDPASLYANSSCIVRMVEYDSVGGTAVEGLLFGRPVIYSRPLEHTIHVPFGDVDELIRVVTELVGRHAAGELAPDTDSARWAREQFDPEKRFRRLAEELTRGLDQPNTRESS